MALWRSFSSVCCTSFGSRPCVVPLHTRSRAFSVRNATASASSDVDQLLPVFEDVKENLQEPTRRSQSSPKEKGPSSYFPKKGQDIELVCESLAYKGNGVCKVVETGFVVLCERALPGERLLARIVKKKRGFAEAYKLKTLSVHHNAVAAPCQHFGDCGGCKTQNLAYHAQLHEKEQQVHDLIARTGRFGISQPDGPTGSYLKPIVPCPMEFHYRNKMEFSFGTQQWVPAESYSSVGQANDEEYPEVTKSESYSEDFALGLHAPKRFDRILPINECLLQHDVANQIFKQVKAYCYANSKKLPAYDVHTHKGFLRHLMIRTGSDLKTGGPQIMVNLVTSTFQPDLIQPLVTSLVDEFPQMVSFVNNVATSVGNTSQSDEEHVLFGGRVITETLRGLQFEISANSFFQTNTSQAEVLYRMVEEQSSLKGDASEIILDLFCGTGTIGLSMAKKAKHVYGYEIVPEAVVDARRNAERNGIRNATFIQSDLNKLINDFHQDFPQPDIVITDPNRPGMHLKLIKFLLNLRARRIVYVSCNPSTCARDLDLLCHGGEGGLEPQTYKLVSVQPVDMFPHTPHIECVCVLDLIERS
ncbi:23S rRNA (uracil1939-C5)-methyltransferase [Marchantia polymorpha subsp. ruderalis]|nr:hypothetical protein MARPO_0054s0113 [Marchantia polymorpha]BBN09023.1 hypothetical protein Mp_4g16480 [Marchantia polymorpha subsp. ruderalis]|eukprot:PTQ38012.1 hypothetical protein MARPO_0054s0113 [Marchantia polymorpha]